MPMFIPQDERDYQFRDALKPLRNKQGACAGCDKFPDKGKTFRTCAACKAELYCSKECQKASWDEHRDRCRQVQHNQDEHGSVTFLWRLSDGTSWPAPDASWPAELSKAQRAVILDRFLTLHMRSIIASIRFLRHSLRSRHPSDLDPEKHALAFVFGYRAGNDENPATRLFVREVRIVGIQGLKQELLRLLGPLAVIEPPPEAFLGNLMVHFLAGGAKCEQFVPLPRTVPPEANSAMSDIGMHWTTHLRVVTTAGIVENPLAKHRDELYSIMRKTGKKWDPVRISHEQWWSIWERRWRYMGPEPKMSLDFLYSREPEPEFEIWYDNRRI